MSTFRTPPLLSRRLLLGLPALLVAMRAAKADAASDAVPAPRRSVKMTDATDLKEALTKAQPGDHLWLEDGSYDGDLDFSAMGKAEAPIVLRARNPGRAVLTGSIGLSGANTILLGLRLDGASVGLAADGTRMTRCRQTGTRSIAVLVTNGHGVSIDHNEFAGMRGRGISLKPDPRDREALKRPHIYRNLIRDFDGEGRENVHEGIQLGQAKSHTNIPLEALVEWNLFQRVSIDSEAISIKSSNNVVRFNTLSQCDAYIANRHGKHNRIVANWLERSRGIQVHDADNAVLGNVLVSCKDGIEIMGGNVTADEWPHGGTHPAADGTLVAGNVTDEVQVGYLYRGHDVPATRTHLAGQGGSIEREAESGTTVTAAGPSDTPKAVRLSPTEVGPDSP